MVSLVSFNKPKCVFHHVNKNTDKFWSVVTFGNFQILKSRQAFDADLEDDTDNVTRTATINVIGPFERKSRRVSFADTDQIRSATSYCIATRLEL